MTKFPARVSQRLIETFSGHSPVLGGPRIRLPQHLSKTPLQATLYTKEVRLINDAGGRLFRRHFPGILTNETTIGDLITMPTAFSLATRIALSNRHLKGKCRLREFLAPILGPNRKDPFHQVPEHEYSDEKLQEAVSVLMEIANDGEDPQAALGAFAALLTRAYRIDPDWFRATFDQETEVSKVMLQAMRISEFCTAALVLHATHRNGSDAERELLFHGIAEDVRKLMNPNHLKHALANIGGEGTFEMRMAQDPNFFRSLEDSAGSGPADTLQKFGEYRKLFTSLQSRDNRRALVTELRSAIEGENIPRNGPTSLGFHSLLAGFVTGKINAESVDHVVEFFTWYILYDPRSAVAIARQIDRELKSDAAIAAVCFALPIDLRRLEATGDTDDTPAGETPDEQIEDEATMAGADNDDPIEEADGTSDAHLDLDGFYDDESDAFSTPPAITARGAWQEAAFAASRAANAIPVEILDVDDPAGAIASLESAVTALHAAHAAFTEAMRPVPVTDLLKRLALVEETVRAETGDGRDIPEIGAVRPHQHEMMISSVESGESASARLSSESLEAKSTGDRMLKAPLSERLNLMAQFEQHTHETMRWAGLAWTSIDTALALLMAPDSWTPDESNSLDATAGVEPPMVTDSATISLPVADSDDAMANNEPPAPIDATPQAAEPVAAIETAQPDPQAWHYPRAASKIREVAIRKGFSSALAQARKVTNAPLADMHPTILEAIRMPGNVLSERYYEREVMDTFELAGMQLAEVPEKDREDMTGLLSAACLEGATFTPGSVYDQVMEANETGLVGRTIHPIRTALSAIVQSNGAPAPGDFMVIRESLASADQRTQVIDELRRDLDVLANSSFTYTPAIHHRKVLFNASNEHGLLGKVQASLDAMRPNAALEARCRELLAGGRSHGAFLDLIAAAENTERLHSGGRMKFMGALDRISRNYVRFAEMSAGVRASSPQFLTLSSAASKAATTLREAAKAEKDAFSRICLVRATEIVGRYSDMVRGEGKASKAA